MSDEPENLDQFDPEKILKQEFEVPMQLLEQLDECSEGGFFLCLLGQDGVPAIYQRYDKVIEKIGMDTHLKNYFETVTEVDKESMYHGIMGPMSLDDDDEENDEE